MAEEPLHSKAMPSQRPPSPTELSYTQLVKLTPSHHGGFRPAPPAVDSTQRNHSATTPGAATARPFNAPISTPHTMHTTTHNEPGGNCIHPFAAPIAGPTDQQIFRNLNTRQSEQFKSNPPVGPAEVAPHPQHLHRTLDITNNHLIQQPPIEIDRVANLAQKLHTTNTQSKQNDIQQFITMLQGMQHTVSRTADEQQRNRKSQALNLLLNMFERVLNDHDRQDDGGKSNQIELDQLKLRVSELENDNKRLHDFCMERDDELVILHQKLQQVNDEKNDLQQSLSRAQDECVEEKKRAREAELIASESESVRDGLFASYGQLTEANVELGRSMEECNAEKQSLGRELECCREDLSQLQMQCNILNQQLKDKDSELAGAEKQLDNMHTQLASHLQSLESANKHRHCLQDELHASQRNATSLSQQLVETREQYAKLRKETDADRRSKQVDESRTGDLTIQLQEEQFKSKDLEVQLTKFQSRELAAQEQIRKLVRANAELKTRLNEMNARLENYRLSSAEKASDFGSLGGSLNLQNKTSVGKDVALNLLDYLPPESSPT